MPPNVFKASGFAVYSLTLITGILSIVAIVFAMIKKFRYSIPMHLVWIFMHIFAMVCFALGFVFLMASALSVEGCDLLDYIENNSTNFDKLTAVKKFPWVAKFKDCYYAPMFTKITIDEPFNITASIPEIMTILEGINNVSAYIPGSYPQSPTVESLRSEILSIIQGLKFAYTQATNEDHPGIAISSMNSWSNYLHIPSSQTNIGQCSISLDEWRFNSTNCTSPVSTDLSEPFLVAPLTEKVCFSVLDSSLEDVENRYTDDSFSSCELDASGLKVNEMIQAFFNATKNHITDVQSTFTALDTFLSGFLASAIDPINNDINELVAPMVMLNKSLFSLLDAYNNSETGILNTMDCSFIGARFTSFQENFCLGFVVPAFSAGAIFVVIGLFGCFGGVFAFFATRKIRLENEEGQQPLPLSLSSPTESYKPMAFTSGPSLVSERDSPRRERPVSIGGPSIFTGRDEDNSPENPNDEIVLSKPNKKEIVLTKIEKEQSNPIAEVEEGSQVNAEGEASPENENVEVRPEEEPDHEGEVVLINPEMIDMTEIWLPNPEEELVRTNSQYEESSPDYVYVQPNANDGVEHEKLESEIESSNKRGWNDDQSEQ